MSTKLVTGDIWSKITATVKRDPRRCHVAVAYFGKGASKLLPLREGSVLVVDMSEAAVKSGQTNPSEILKLVNRGVNVHSVNNLHAKVFVVNSRVFLGSANVSQSAANRLIEAVVDVTNQEVADACRKFINSLSGEQITPKYAKQMAKLYREPQFPIGGGKRGKRQITKGAKAKVSLPVVPVHSPVWVLGFYQEKPDAEYLRQKELGMPKARAALRSTRRFVVETFELDIPRFLHNAKKGDLIVQVVDGKKKRRAVHPPGRLLHIQRYKEGQEECCMGFVEIPKGENHKDVKEVVKRLGTRARRFLGKAWWSTPDKEVNSQSFAHALLNLWPSVAKKQTAP